MDDFLSLEPLIVARLKDKVTQARDVASAADLAGVELSKMKTPALHVLPAGYKPTQSKPGSSGTVQQIEQTWWIVAAVKNLKDPKVGAKAREDAGPLIAATLKALLGWKAGDDFTPLSMAPGPAPRFESGFARFPLAFKTLISVQGG